MKLATDAIGWEKRKSSKKETKGAVKRGIGMASYLVLQGVGLHPYVAEAKVAIHHDGTINSINTGCQRRLISLL